MAKQECSIDTLSPKCRLCGKAGPLAHGRRICPQCRYQQHLERGIKDPEKRITQQQQRREGERIRIAANPGRQRARQRRWRTENRVTYNALQCSLYPLYRLKRLAKKKADNIADPERFRRYRATTYYRDIEASREKQRGYYWKDPKKRRAQIRVAEQNRLVNDPVHVRALRFLKAARHKAKKSGMPFLWNIGYAHFALEWWDFSCAYCNEPLFDGFWHGLNWEHFIPLSCAECPGTVPWNILPSCGILPGKTTGGVIPLCNQSKGTADARTWLLRVLIARRVQELGRPCTSREVGSIKGAVTRKLQQIACFFAEAYQYAVVCGDVVSAS